MITSTVPLNKYFVIEVDETATTTESGIILGKKSQTIPYSGVVVAVGHKIENELSVGDRIHHKKTAGIDFIMNGKMHKFLEEDDIIVIV